MHSQTDVVNELCKDAVIPPVSERPIEDHCDHPKTFCGNGMVTVDYVENYWCPVCNEKIDMGCAGDCNECCKQPCNGEAATGYESSSSSLSREDEYMVVPRNLAADLENEAKVQLCTGCNAEPDEDGFCDGICFCCYLKQQRQQEEALPKMMMQSMMQLCTLLQPVALVEKKHQATWMMAFVKSARRCYRLPRNPAVKSGKSYPMRLFQELW